jgi:predicted HicB family RNase H-like nuclease
VEEKSMKQAQYTKSLTIALPPEHYEQIKRITDDQKISIAEWVRDAVEASLKKCLKEENWKNDK